MVLSTFFPLNILLPPTLIQSFNKETGHYSTNYFHLDYLAYMLTKCLQTSLILILRKGCFLYYEKISIENFISQILQLI